MTKKKIKIIDQSSHHIIFWGNDLWFKHLDLKKINYDIKINWL